MALRLSILELKTYQWELKKKKPRFLCLHGFRTSAEIMQKQLTNWPESITEKMDLVFINAPNPAQRKSSVGNFFDPPYYKWFEYDEGATLTNVPKIKFLIIIGGGMVLNPALAEKAFVPPIKCPSVHLIGQRDYIRPHGNKLLECFVDPLVIRHPKGHVIPELDEKGSDTMQMFLEKIEKSLHINNTINGGIPNQTRRIQT
ncbi:hypothetical protein AQUCO_05600106v1 [Aquilegia coerulea]|uniref:Serine hydrolase domain-containing protein n=1 Tax=Aquilegia coerulea TaxID=218851 RepID=A0A2G5CGK5_AQUCA|nr:hypothetical protein AQUCO_05600106v1 [Aquilegia coerulea]